MTKKRTIFSGVQPTGNLHLGNYLGAIRNWAVLQNDFECVFCVVDLHAITTWQPPRVLRNNIREVTAAMIASGVDADKNVIFSQSRVPAHAELAWIFNCVARLGWLNRMTQFKDKVGKDKEGASVGLYAYPNLMAADILAYKATHVPVGADQKQHLELCREIAAKFNSDFSVDFFPLVKPIILDRGMRVMSLKDGTKKMSKSDPSELSRIMLTDSSDMIAKKIRKAKTDAIEIPAHIEDLKGRLEINNLVEIYAALANCSPQAVLDIFGGLGHAKFKDDLADVVIETFNPIKEKLDDLLKNPDYIDEVLNQGAERAKTISEPVLKDVHKILGFLA